MASLHIGKQTVYHALQNSAQDAGPDAIAALNEKIRNTQDQLSAIKADEKRVRATLAVLETKPRMSDLERDIQQLEVEHKAIQAQLGNSQDDDEAPISVEERGKLEQEWKQWQRRATFRRRICRDLWSQCTEVLPENTTSLELWVSCHCHEELAEAADGCIGVSGA